MTHEVIKEKVIGFVHTKDAKGEWILPWAHKTDCHICDQLTEFIEGLLVDHAKEMLKPQSPASDGWKHFKFAGSINGPTFCLRENKPGVLYIVDDHETHTCK